MKRQPIRKLLLIISLLICNTLLFQPCINHKCRAERICTMNKITCGIIDNTECIHCGACVDDCPKNILSYGMRERKENSNGKREKN